MFYLKTLKNMTIYKWPVLFLIFSLVFNVNAQELSLSSLGKLNQIVSEDNMSDTESQEDSEDTSFDKWK